MNRRHFLKSSAILCSSAVALSPRELFAQRRLRQSLADRFADLSRHFIFEYYAWYETNPYWHWNQSDRNPPIDLASNYMPKLGAYDSRSTAVMEQHASWIAESGAGAINVSWWGRDSDVDRL